MHTYKNLFYIITALFLSISYSYGQKHTAQQWKVVIVSATQEPNIRLGATQFIADAKAQFTAASEAMQLPVEFTVLEGRELNPKKLSELREQLLATKGNQTLLTWVSFTHGFNTANSQSKYPYLVAHPTKTVLSPSEMRYAFSLETLYQDLVASGKFASVHIWAELCNQVCTGCSIQEQEGLASLSPGIGNKRMLQDIFLQNQGSLMVSSSYGQESCSSVSGGPFSQALFKVLEMAMMGGWQADPKAPTQSFLDMAQEMTQYFLQQLPNAACQNQEPMGEVFR